MLHLNRVRARNWRNFRDLDVALGPRTFLVGPNASGKSNFLELFRFLQDLARNGGGLQTAIAERDGLSKIRCLAAREHPDIEIEVELGAGPSLPALWRYELVIGTEVRGRRTPRVKHEGVWHEGREILSRPDNQDRVDPLRLSQTHLEQINANQEFRPIADFFKGVLYLHLVPQLLRRPESYGRTPAEDPFGRRFLERVALTPQKKQRGRLGRIARALRIAAPQMEGLKLVKDETGRPHLESVYSHWRSLGARQREDQFSDGTLRLIALLWSLLEDDTLLLLEEPELSLNGAIVRRLAPLIARMQRANARQVVVSTHSAELLSDKGIGADEVLLFRPGREGTEIQSGAKISEARHLLDSGMTPAEVLIPHSEPVDAMQLDLFE